MPDIPGRRLGLLLLGWFGFVVGAIVLAPFTFAPDLLQGAAWERLGSTEPRDVILNVVLFLPLGFLLERVQGGRWGILAIGLAGLGVSAIIESLQLMLPGRFSAVTDIAANAAGAAAGAYASSTIRSRIGAGAVLVSRFFLDLPLVALAWMLVPLTWLLAIDGLVDPDRSYLAVAIAAAAGTALAAAGRSGPITAEARGPRLARIGLGWATIALLPAIAISPLAGAAALGALALAMGTGDLWWKHATRTERRVEPIAVLVVLLLLSPWFVTTSPDLGSLSWNGGGQRTRSETLGLLEVVVAYAVLGFALAEQRGREARGWLTGASLAVGVTLVVAGPLFGGAGLVRLVLLVLAALAGTVLYRQQRADIMSLIRGVPTAPGREEA